MKRVLAVLAAAAMLALLPGTVAAADEVFSGQLRGSSEVPPVTTNGAGAAYVFINEAETEVKYAVSYTGLTGPVIAAHIHVGPAGQNGPIMLPLTVGPSTMFGTLTQADFQASSGAATWDAALDAIRSGNTYVNLHTSQFPGGEVRAQLAAAAASPSPTATTAPTPRATVTAAPTSTATPAATAANTGAAGTPPPTSTLPASGRGSVGDFASILLILGVAGAAAAAAAWKLQPPRRRRDDWD